MRSNVMFDDKLSSLRMSDMSDSFLRYVRYHVQLYKALH
jgi:hypothetical protein